MSESVQVQSRSQQPLPAHRLDALVVQLNELQRTATLEHSLRVGRLIVSEVYGGELRHWRADGEHVSFRQLAARTQVDLKMSATSLFRAVALYDLCSRLPMELWRDFGAGHLRAVLGLSENQQVRLLSAAKVNDWTARELYQRARQAPEPPTTGTSSDRQEGGPESPLVRTLRRLTVKLHELERLAADIDRDSLRNIIVGVRDAVDRLAEIVILPTKCEPERPLALHDTSAARGSDVLTLAE
jgi:hypothetical protein